MIYILLGKNSIRKTCSMVEIIASIFIAVTVPTTPPIIVPTNPMSFFPSRVKSVSNMAEYNLAKRYFTILQIQVPTIIIGLLPKN